MIKSILSFRGSDGKYHEAGASTELVGDSTESVVSQALSRFGRCAFRLEHWERGKRIAVQFFVGRTETLC